VQRSIKEILQIEKLRDFQFSRKPILLFGYFILMEDKVIKKPMLGEPTSVLDKF
tara:strand:+ start:5543 stop:5704 length:162 start_codon:yes stop_codon:yes gene_type:complete